MIHKDVEKVLVSEQELKEINERLGKRITSDFKGKNLLVLGILKGCVFFMTDLVRHIELPLSIDFMSVSSYGSGTESTGRVKITKDIDIDLNGYDVLIVEDILDSGRTLKYVSDILKTRGAKSISIVTLLDKPERLPISLPIMWGAVFRMSSLWGMVLTMIRNTEICPISAH